jgi:hypothetical protein
LTMETGLWGDRGGTGPESGVKTRRFWLRVRVSNGAGQGRIVTPGLVLGRESRGVRGMFLKWRMPPCVVRCRCVPLPCKFRGSASDADLVNCMFCRVRCPVPLKLVDSL